MCRAGKLSKVLEVGHGSGRHGTLGNSASQATVNKIGRMHHVVAAAAAVVVLLSLIAFVLALVGAVILFRAGPFS